jgi:Na+/proline symporter
VSTFAALGADHDMAQRLLTCRRMKDSQKAIILSGYATFPVVLLFLFLGTGLFVYFQTHPEFALPELSTKVFPFFIVEVLPRGLSGLLVAGVIAAAMSSLDSAMNALASTAVLDIYQPYIRPHASRKELMRVSRAAILVTASALMLFAWGCRGSEGVLFLGFKLVSFTYGAILGVFLLGILTRRGSDRGNAAAMLGSSLLVTALHFTQKALVDRGVLESAPVGWSWYLLIGTLATLGIGACFRGGGESGAR